MAFMTMKTIVIKNKKLFLTFFNLFLLFSVYLLPSRVNYTSSMTLLLWREGASLQNITFFLRNLYEFTRFDTGFSHKKKPKF